MLEKVDLKNKVSKETYKETMETLGLRLGAVQRAAREAGRPVIILFEGWNGDHRSDIINEMMQYMDARGFNVYSTVCIDEIMKKQPFFTYFWQHLPAKDQMAVYHRSWYYLKELADYNKHDDIDFTCMSYEHINAFEKALAEDDYIIIKFFLHVSAKQQEKNLKEAEKTFGKLLHNAPMAIDESKDYKHYLKLHEQMLQATDTTWCPWKTVAADDLRNAKLEVYTTVAETIEAALNTEKVVEEPQRPEVKYDELSKVVPYQEMSKEEYKVILAKYQKKMAKLQMELYKAGISTVIGLEGWDAGGKGGAIRRLTSGLDPLGYSVHPVAAPNAVERQYHYLWRFWRYLPLPGLISIFDRTWYGRVMVERLEGFAKTHEWERAYAEINDMEQQWTEHGMVVVKFWLQIDQDEQLRRFTERQNTPEKQWKITEEDWRNREKWGAYEEAVNEMIARTNTKNAPWVIVEGNNKYYARLKAMKTVIDLWEAKLKEIKK